MKIVGLLLIGFLSISAAKANEPVRIEDWTLSSPFTYGLLKGLTLGLYDAKKPEIVVQEIPTVAQLPIGLVSYIERHNAFSRTLGTVLGAIFSSLMLLFIFLGIYYRVRPFS